MSCSGGEASLMADAGVKRKVNYRELKQEQRQPLRETLGQMVTISNPLDYHTFVWGNREKQTAAFTTMMQGGYALNLVVLDFPRLDRCDAADWITTCHAVIDASKATGANAGIVASMGENMPEATAEMLMQNGVVPFYGIEEALAAAEAAAGIGDIWTRPLPAPLLKTASGDGEAITLTEHEAKQALVAHGLTVPQGITAETADAAADAAQTLGFPVVLKGLGVAHKTEAGAVKLNLASREAVLDASKAMAGVASGFLVEKMVGKPVAEFIVGAVRDPVAGPVLTIGAGGILDENTIREAISGLKIAKLLDGYRGGPKGDIDALVAAVASAASYVVSNASIFEELDVNPVMVLPAGDGVVAADALIRLRKNP
jgi:acyl-CoA synthetase (NDP forming)